MPFVNTLLARREVEPKSHLSTCYCCYYLNNYRPVGFQGL